jgi:hypothetical protein
LQKALELLLIGDHGFATGKDLLDMAGYVTSQSIGVIFNIGRLLQW